MDTGKISEKFFGRLSRCMRTAEDDGNGIGQSADQTNGLLNRSEVFRKGFNAYSLGIVPGEKTGKTFFRVFSDPVQDIWCMAGKAKAPRPAWLVSS